MKIERFWDGSSMIRIYKDTPGQHPHYRKEYLNQGRKERVFAIGTTASVLAEYGVAPEDSFFGGYRHIINRLIENWDKQGDEYRILLDYDGNGNVLHWHKVHSISQSEEEIDGIEYPTWEVEYCIYIDAKFDLDHELCEVGLPSMINEIKRRVATEGYSIEDKRKLISELIDAIL